MSQEETPEGATVYKSIPDFRFINQDSQVVTPATFSDKAYVADFFFTSCPTICPIMAQNMLSLYNDFEGEERLAFLSHTIDPARDTVGQLKHYATNLGVTDQRWQFVTGNKDSLYAIADDYFNVVVEDPTLPDGFDHSGRFVLVDEQGYIRSFCNGTDPTAVAAFKKDIETLLHEMENANSTH
ncbi:MAG: SCO family protein [Phaeodactylibacter sp.]|uniref:SCO family protein n=1 Tax=Phaeodactylibacter sp. TaxID=1940289 RepID=UPI0032F04227